VGPRVGLDAVSKIKIPSPRREWGKICTASCILNLGTRWRRVVRFKPRKFYSRGISRRYPFDRKLGGPKKRSGGHGGDKKKIPLMPLPGNVYKSNIHSEEKTRTRDKKSLLTCIKFISKIKYTQNRAFFLGPYVL
jgi:hypothetical protein